MPEPSNKEERYLIVPHPLQKVNNKTCFDVSRKRMLDSDKPNNNEASLKPESQRTLPSVSMETEEQEEPSSISMVSSTSRITGINWKQRTLLARRLCLTLRASFSDREDFLFFLFLCFLLLLTTMNRILMYLI